jgi:hypothetical protein
MAEDLLGSRIGWAFFGLAASFSALGSAGSPAMNLRLLDIQPRFICQAYGKRGADVRLSAKST